MRPLLLAAVLSLAAVPALAQDTTQPEITVDSAPIIMGAIEGYIRPAFHQFASDVAAMKSDVGALCAAPAAAALTKAQADFKLAAASYSRIVFLRFGLLFVVVRVVR